MANPNPALRIEAAKKAKANTLMRSTPHPSQYADALGTLKETTQGVGPINAHPRPVGMGRHMGGTGRAPGHQGPGWIAR